MDDDMSGWNSVASRNTPAYRTDVFSPKARKVDRDYYNSCAGIVSKRETARPERVMDACGESRVCSERNVRTKPAKVYPSVAIPDGVILVVTGVGCCIGAENWSDINSSGSGLELRRRVRWSKNACTYNCEEYETSH
tara:strand:+ start:780 stop:1190 length:411 start_codon:yes stop_codon:yes gene_type:complete